ncbi:MAG TPA: hypothetical protein HA282_01240 [Nanoarchaeota archaeon]|nr:hypothetical protein [Candidatus Pacearchaeota archaeon]HIH17976.1 hypothetical protein [Nanoarchaeota archaeon]HIH33844.1 hypothetical protein [Nanoarchaeota archaeon]HIH50787.1 hypothetical protein [Nanoarchaeota archaeon]HIH65823.1 hypothetical protein [Nanoarchaeota archaeon]
MFRVFRSDWYDQKVQKLDKSEQQIISKFEQRLKEQPYSGKPLGYKFFREMRFGNKRLLFLVYDEHSSIFLVTITDKKAQQHEIDLIKTNLDVYKDALEKLVKDLKLP